MIVYVDQKGKPSKTYTAGWHNKEKQIPAKPNALFKIGSITKLYVAAATAKLVHSNKLSLDKTVADYLPELTNRIKYANKITLRMLVQHRSGIPNYTDTPGFWENPIKENNKALQLILDKPANFKPDESYSYCNTNYLLIGKILDKTLGYSHHDYIKNEILKPLNLNHTYSLQSQVKNLDNLMSGYYVGYDYDMKFDEFISPAGSMIASAEDVGVFIRALNDGSLFNNEEQSIYSSIYEYNHGGLLPGYQSLAKYNKELDLVVIQFINTTDFEGYQWNISEIVINRIVKIIEKQSSNN